MADKGIWIAARAYGTKQAAAHTAPVYVLTDRRGFKNDDAVAKIVNAMLTRLEEFDALKVDAGSELEVWSVDEPLKAKLADQPRQILQRVDEARKVYAAMVDRP